MILIIKYAGIGDLIMTLPAYYYLCDKHGRDNVYWMVDGKFRQFIEIFVPKNNLFFMDFEMLHKSIVHKMLLIFSVNFLILRKNFKKVYLFHSNFRYKLFLLTSFFKNENYCYKFFGRQNIISGRYSGLNFFSIVSSLDGPCLEKFNMFFDKVKTIVCGVVRSYDGLFLENFQLKEKYIICSPGYGGNPGDQSSNYRKLSLEKWKEIIQKCKGMGFKVVLTGGASEIEDLSNLYQFVDHNFVGKTNFIDLFYLMQNSNGVICTDNGQYHIATLSGCRVFAIFGPSNFLERCPPKVADIFQINLDLPPCAPCHDGRLVYECQSKICLNNFEAGHIANFLK